jgi:CubicO group peptidase (beta-lactamase class C family)
MVVGITDKGERRFITHGRTCLTGDLLDETAIFEIGSVTKVFTALLLTDMVSRGEVALDEAVTALLPSSVRVPDCNGHPITLRFLAMHLSGLPRLPTNLEPNDPANPYGGYTADRLYEFLATYELTRPPGDMFEYSNLGFGLLGHALGLRGGLNYEALVRARILAPLGMVATAVHLPPNLAHRLAPGHNDSLDAVPGWEFAALAGAGGLRSSAADLLLFLEALCIPETSPLGPAARILLAPHNQGGLEFVLPQPGGSPMLQHEGGTGGYRSYVGCIPALRRGVVVLSNSIVGAVSDLGAHVLDTRWAPLWFRQEAEVNPATFDRLVGLYRLSPAMVLQVTRTGDRLFARLSGQPAYRIFPMSEWRFFYKTVGAQITFEPDNVTDRATRLILHQNGRDIAAPRIECTEIHL